MTNRYYFYSKTALKIIRAAQQGAKHIDVSLDLNLSGKQWEITDNRLVLEPGCTLDIQELEPVCRTENKIFIYENQQLKPLEFRGQGYYKLVPTKTVPTLEINGIKMHRSKDIDPLTDARLKTQKVVRPGDVVLDTCGGLGYSALYALKAGAQKVISTEKDQAVLYLRKLNPWTKDDPHLELICADICQKIPQFKDNCFNSIIHDPPRFTSATGDLYGKPFYQALFRVLTPRGRLFHYTGSPKKIKEQDRFLRNTKKRLEVSGFGNVRFKERLQGFLADKNDTLTMI